MTRRRFFSCLLIPVVPSCLGDQESHVEGPTTLYLGGTGPGIWRLSVKRDEAGTVITGCERIKGKGWRDPEFFIRKETP